MTTEPLPPGSTRTRTFRWAEVQSLPRFTRLHKRIGPDAEEVSEDFDVHGCVVVGCDGDADSDAALRFAVHEASLRAARLVLLSSYQACIDPDIDDYDTPAEVLRGRAIATAEKSLCRALRRTPDSLPPHRVIVGQGLPSRILLRQCGDAELIVLGAHHRSTLKRLFAGHRTSRQLIRHGHVPVVIVPPDPSNP